MEADMKRETKLTEKKVKSDQIFESARKAYNQKQKINQTQNGFRRTPELSCALALHRQADTQQENTRGEAWAFFLVRDSS